MLFIMFPMGTVYNCAVQNCLVCQAELFFTCWNIKFFLKCQGLFQYFYLQQGMSTLHSNYSRFWEPSPFYTVVGFHFQYIKTLFFIAILKNMAHVINNTLIKNCMYIKHLILQGANTKHTSNSPSFLFAGGFLVAQLVLMLRLPNHWPKLFKFCLCSCSCSCFWSSFSTYSFFVSSTSPV